ncbi:uncharacterized protein LOC121430461 [Lytechinus variegatus]|uniref:uncharacterized protein LOC121430461 n=1 Tax=Lytechinus variegatus TaxID=7654 RepID=UPI001BB2AC74|nr:uncharacterized protein LOC121430461 [Lytechinus variegatus]
MSTIKISKIPSSDSPTDLRVPIIIPVCTALVLLSVAVGILVYCRRKHDAQRPLSVINTSRADRQATVNDRYRIGVHGKTIQEEVPLKGESKPPKIMPELPNIPKEAVQPTPISGDVEQERIYHEPDFVESSVPSVGIALGHEYLDSGQRVPARGTPSVDEIHEYTYPKLERSQFKGPARVNRVAEDGYLLAEPDIQPVPNPTPKVYYSSRFPKCDNKDEPSKACANENDPAPIGGAKLEDSLVVENMQVYYSRNVHHSAGSGNQTLELYSKTDSDEVIE